MKLIWHIVWKDIARLRLWILGWLVVLALPLLVATQALGRGLVPEADWKYPSMVSILAGFTAAVGYLLTLLIVLGDAVVGTTQFWLTRPISRGRLLVAKAIAAFLVVGLLPVIVSLPWWGWCGFTLPQMFRGAAETIAVMWLVIAAGGLVAALTDSLGRAVLWSLVLVTTGVVAVIVFVAVTRDREQGEPNLIISGATSGVVLVGLQMTILIIVQFLVRRRGWWLAAGVLAFGATVFWSTRAKVSWFGERPREWRAHEASALQVEYRAARAENLSLESIRARSARGELVQQRIETDVNVVGIPSDLSLAGGQAWQEWTSPGSFTVSRMTHVETDADFLKPLGLRWRLMEDDAETRTFLEQARAPREPQWQATPRFNRDALAYSYLPPSLVARMKVSPMAYRSVWWMQLVRPKNLVEIPLAEHDWSTQAGYALRVTGVRRSPRRVEVWFNDTHPRFLSSLLQEMADGCSWLGYMRARGPRLLVINRESQTVVSGDEYETRSVTVNGVEIRWRRAAFPVPVIVRDGKWQVVETWLDRATFALVAIERAAMIKRSVVVEPYLLSESP